jgi:hypothetical protein
MELMEKVSVRRDTAVSIGKKVEDMLEGAQRKAYEAGGAKKAMLSHVKNLLGIVAAVDEEVEKSIPDLEHAKVIKSWLMRCVAATENYVGHLSNLELQALGEATGYTASRDFIFKIVKEIDESSERLASAIKSGSVQVEEDGSLQQVGEGPRPPGVRPGLSIAQQRKAEEAAAQAAAAAPVEEPVTKKRKRSK